MLPLEVDDKVTKMFSALQRRERKNKNPLKWISCMLEKDKLVVVDKAMDASDVAAFMEKAETKSDDMDDAVHHLFAENLMAAEGPRFGIVDYRDNVFFVSYIVNAKPKKRMIYATLRQQFKESLTGIKYDLQCTDAGDLAKENFDGKLKEV